MYYSLYSLICVHVPSTAHVYIIEIGHKSQVLHITFTIYVLFVRDASAKLSFSPIVLYGRAAYDDFILSKNICLKFPHKYWLSNTCAIVNPLTLLTMDINQVHWQYIRASIYRWILSLLGVSLQHSRVICLLIFKQLDIYTFLQSSMFRFFYHSITVQNFIFFLGKHSIMVKAKILRKRLNVEAA